MESSESTNISTETIEESINIENISKESEEIKSKYLYLAADFENYKKRVAKNEQYVREKAYETVVLEFLRIYDDMERLYESLDFVSDEPTTEISKEHAAYSMIFENLEKTLNNLGCEKIDCHKGDAFDVNYMEAISSRVTKLDEYVKENEVADIFQSGWKMNGKTIRPVKVVVGK